ncbi:hypothetical protein CWI36_0106p0010 [Hamiltosporidium magnivora]|uniref:Uncharacterized protein n=1 Tax=Hamiltosporidium magnivora TaxID=148818 RepID=A0A4Q9LJ64_9MICR|nr:hypothetical protein CWI36_0212p0040 [Hamiltosporidium magnivora]TBU08698.1 hypothetical protein CWI36_0106p0010 [Hamiltosporidium magnivora]
MILIYLCLIFSSGVELMRKRGNEFDCKQIVSKKVKTNDKPFVPNESNAQPYNIDENLAPHDTEEIKIEAGTSYQMDYKEELRSDSSESSFSNDSYTEADTISMEAESESAKNFDEFNKESEELISNTQGCSYEHFNS